MNADPVLAQARALAQSHNLRIIAKCNPRGEVITWRVFRQMPERLVYLGERISPEATLRFVRALAGSAVAAP